MFGPQANRALMSSEPLTTNATHVASTSWVPSHFTTEQSQWRDSVDSGFLLPMNHATIMDFSDGFGGMTAPAREAFSQIVDSDTHLLNDNDLYGFSGSTYTPPDATSSPPENSWQGLLDWPDDMSGDHTPLGSDLTPDWISDVPATQGPTMPFRSTSAVLPGEEWRLGRVPPKAGTTMKRSTGPTHLLRALHKLRVRTLLADHCHYEPASISFLWDLLSELQATEELCGSYAPVVRWRHPESDQPTLQPGSVRLQYDLLDRQFDKESLALTRAIFQTSPTHGNSQMDPSEHAEWRDHDQTPWLSPEVHRRQARKMVLRRAYKKKIRSTSLRARGPD